MFKRSLILLIAIAGLAKADDDAFEKLQKPFYFKRENTAWESALEAATERANVADAHPIKKRMDYLSGGDGNSPK
jgi:hypothetical protein